MNILVGNSKLSRTGGTETFTYALIVELLRQSHNVEYFTFEKGLVSDKIEKLGVHFCSKRKYDLILANHNTVVDALYGYGFIVQTCHGVVPALEQPSEKANAYVAISEEIHNHLRELGHESLIIWNGIDCERFFPQTKIHDKLTTVLSLSYSATANKFIQECCEQIHVNFIQVDKLKDNVWEIENIINKADLVIGIGRSLYDSIACGRSVISFDYREYSQPIGDGYITIDNITNYLPCNCSGRVSHKTFTKAQFIEELKKYTPEDGTKLRNFAIQRLNMKDAVPLYVSLYNKAHYKSICTLIGALKRHTDVISKMHIWISELYKYERREKELLSCLKKSTKSTSYIETSNSSDVIANSVFVGENKIVARGDSIFRVTSQGEKLLLQVPESSDWRLMYVDSNLNVYVSPHSSISGNIECSRRGLYRLSLNDNEFKKVLSLYVPNSSDILLAEENDDTIWTMCEDKDGYLYAGVYAHTMHKRPVIYRSSDQGNTWNIVYNFVNNDQQATHIHCIHYDKYKDCLYCLVGELNTLFRSTDKGVSWVDLKLHTEGLFAQKCTMITSSPTSRILGSDERYNAEIYITDDDKNYKVVYQGWAGTIFGFRWSDISGNLYAFTKIDASVENSRVMPPIEYKHNIFKFLKWLKQGMFNKKDWIAYYLSCKNRYPADAYRPESSAILVSQDNGNTWNILHKEIVGSESNYGFWTAGLFHNGCCEFSLVGKGERGKQYTKTILVKEVI